MEKNTLKYKDRNTFICKAERFLLKIMFFIIIPSSVIAYFFSQNFRILNSLPTLLSLTALIQLEVCGLFEYLDFFSQEIDRIHDESNGRLVPSSLSRAIYEFYNPEPGIKNFFNNQLYFNKKFSFYLLCIAGLLQLYINYFF